MRRFCQRSGIENEIDYFLPVQFVVVEFLLRYKNKFLPAKYRNPKKRDFLLPSNCLECSKIKLLLMHEKRLLLTFSLY